MEWQRNVIGRKKKGTGISAPMYWRNDAHRDIRQLLILELVTANEDFRCNNDLWSALNALFLFSMKRLLRLAETFLQAWWWFSGKYGYRTY